MSLIKIFSAGLARSKAGFVNRLGNLFGAGELDDLFYEDLEETLITGDVGVNGSLQIVAALKEKARALGLKERTEVKNLLKGILIERLTLGNSPSLADNCPHIILLVGVNGSGKTTAAAKLANYYREQGKKVMLVAGDTFRAAATEQLEIWAKRADADLIKQQTGSDPAALFFDAVNAARARNTDVVIGDTAGRLHSKYNLMEELNKIYRVIDRNHPGAPHAVYLVIDATTGQNAIAQARHFNRALPLNGIILTKLDGTARGGIVIGIQDELEIPVCFVGLGEKIEDLVLFDPQAFVDALLFS
ncbi:MAG: signal recognition particle-docking protein FtsY [Firmicutes bacterium ML8_F2]|nr:MAG: signal recognition particle-docking protein FtsY [Firmicutes bacterium ML8_F2]